MTRRQRLLQHILMKKGDENIAFDALCQLLRKLGFEERIKGDHHIFSMTSVAEIVNLQPKGAKAKPYQEKQVRDLVLRYGLSLKG